MLTRVQCEGWDDMKSRMKEFFLPEINFCWADHIPDRYTPILTAGYHHSVHIAEFETEQ